MEKRNNMIKSLAKRKELAEMVYNRYGGLTDEEKPEYANEVGAAFEAYEKAIDEACEWMTSYYLHHASVNFLEMKNELIKAMKEE